MSKKLVFLMSIVVASSIISGCAMVKGGKDSTVKAIILSPSVHSVPMVAELEVSNKKVIGQAKGQATAKNGLEKEAVTEALKQTDGDVLVGANFFYETTGVNLTVTVTGYPAHYKNFRPKEVSSPKEEILVGGNFFYEDGSKNNISVSIKKPNPAVTAPTSVAPATPAAPVDHAVPTTPNAQ